ncbi:MAG: methyltransferase type 11 [[Chlorobium] sp. 445]|nr:MAG: methyltransferase type 11 [[Chlorobium] sp. 445]
MQVSTLIRIFKNVALHRFGKCSVCGRRTLFLVGNMLNVSHVRESLICIFCRSASRKRHVAVELLRHFALPLTSLAEHKHALQRFKIYSAVSDDPIYHALGKDHPNYITSEFFPDVAPGERKNGVLCQTLEALTFADASFDVVITEDVLEHVRYPDAAFREIHRVLKPGGAHIFTVPLTLDQPTVERVRFNGETIEHLLPPEYHGDALRGKILAYRNFGIDLFDRLTHFGFQTRLSLAQYQDTVKFGIADSIVLVSIKQGTHEQ